MSAFECMSSSYLLAKLSENVVLFCHFVYLNGQWEHTFSPPFYENSCSIKCTLTLQRHMLYVYTCVCCTSTPVRCAPLRAMLLSLVLFYGVVCCGVIEVDSSPLYPGNHLSLMCILPLSYWAGPTRGGMR